MAKAASLALSLPSSISFTNGKMPPLEATARVASTIPSETILFSSTTADSWTSMDNELFICWTSLGIVSYRATSMSMGSPESMLGAATELTLIRQAAIQSLCWTGMSNFRIRRSDSVKRAAFILLQNFSESISFVSSREAADIARPASSTSRACLSGGQSSASASVKPKFT